MNAEPDFVHPSLGRTPHNALYMRDADKFVTFETLNGGELGGQVEFNASV
jgi:hypothetical protein